MDELSGSVQTVEASLLHQLTDDLIGYLRDRGRSQPLAYTCSILEDVLSLKYSFLSVYSPVTNILNVLSTFFCLVHVRFLKAEVAGNEMHLLFYPKWHT